MEKNFCKGKSRGVELPAKSWLKEPAGCVWVTAAGFRAEGGLRRGVVGSGLQRWGGHVARSLEAAASELGLGWRVLVGATVGLQ